MDIDFSRRIGSALGRGGFLIGERESFAMENRIRDWMTNNKTASWATLPDQFKKYILLVERS